VATYEEEEGMELRLSMFTLRSRLFLLSKKLIFLDCPLAAVKGYAA